MSLTVSPNTDFEAVAQGFDTGLVGTIGYSIEDGDGVTVVAFTTSGIVETPEASGIYTASIEGLADGEDAVPGEGAEDLVGEYHRADLRLIQTSEAFDFPITPPPANVPENASSRL